ncbi:unnamed protein product [Arctia plantaginis]|uniref:Uncharacterized protein n=1 Tax=Arctia plantaginis TaxID=874455 RepID=A0A8S1APX6_ARCPL|nr:unnamed protein product [Arctia plantaginis]
MICITVSWLVLGCKFAPEELELSQVTLLKFLYLYDPQSCGRLYLYNITNVSDDRVQGNIVWPLQNSVAASFRSKIQIWLVLHLLWLLFAIINMTQGERSCSFYATLLPFTLIGLSLLVVDVVFASIFVTEAAHTGSEGAILKYMSQTGHLRAINERPLAPRRKKPIDTSWMALLLAFMSLRGIVQWIVNFWIVQDNYVEGVKRYRYQQSILGSKAKSPNDFLLNDV